MLLLAGARAPTLTPAAAAALTAPCERAIHSSIAVRRLLTSAGGCWGCGGSCSAHPHRATPAVRQTLTTPHKYPLLRRAVSIFCYLSYSQGCNSTRCLSVPPAR